MLVKEIPYDQIPFPCYKNGAFDRFVLIKREDYQNRIRPRLDPRKVMLFDLYVGDPVNTFGYLEANKSFAVLHDIADTTTNFPDVDKIETPAIKDKFRDKLVKELKAKGFKIVNESDVVETMDVTPNEAHKKNFGKNLFEGDIGELWTKYDSSIPAGKVREKSTLQVVVAEKQ